MSTVSTSVAKPPVALVLLRRAAITLAALIVLAALFWVPWHALFGPAAQWPTAVTVTGTVVFAVAFLSFPVLIVRGHRRGSDAAARIADTMLGVVWLLFAWAVLTHLLRLVLALSGVDNPLRGRIVALALAGIVVVLVVYGVAEAMRLPRIRQVDVTLPRLGAAFDGLRLVMITDTHFGPIDRTAWGERVIAAVNELEPDVVVHDGDLADGTVEQRAGQVAALGEVAAEQRFYVSGNHEYFSGAQSWLDHMDTLGWTGLHNQHRVLERDGQRLVFAGVDDATAAASGEPGHGQNLAAALHGTAPGDPIVLLAHQPSQIGHAVAAQVDLQLSGHTHGGQIWPFHLLVRAQQRALQGLTRHGEHTQLYTSRGTGFWGPPLRVFAPSEITMLTLRAGTADRARPDQPGRLHAG
ncbi:metallophosphoesterase [Amycolatopsis suaedae]|uniref:Metallophosphoesterase n=1 Tax=Amycolatopsis suaedae TaxID=2510978 RepID=A0A4Q7J6F9_9PSEU|nr:metallophosphoesterase [Amycolatopsis suaedae]RZQ62478.1 metallophosphoesterase [Amycolatopsis suaedae]